MSRVIAVIDHSETSTLVDTMARAVAEAVDASVELVDIERDDEADYSLTLAGGPSVRHLSGDPRKTLLLVAAEEDVVAIVIGARAQSSGAGPAGQVAMTLAGLTDKPVVVVPPGSRPPEHLRRAVVATEATPDKTHALQRSIEFSARAGLEIVVVHVHDEESTPSFSDQMQHEAGAYAAEFLSRHMISAPQVRLELHLGIPADEILAAIESTHAELVVVGWPRSKDPRRGAVAKEILDRSPVAVLLVATA